MNKTKQKLVLFIAFLSAKTSLVAYAADTEGDSNVLDELLPRPGEDYQYGDLYPEPELEAIGNLPEITPEAAFTTAIKTILGATMGLTVVAIAVVGFYYLSNQGDDESIEKAKKIIIYLLIGLAIMAGSYGIIAGVLQFDFFRKIG